MPGNDDEFHGLNGIRLWLRTNGHPGQAFQGPRTVVKFDASQVGTTLTNGQEVMPIQPRSRSPAPSLILLPFLQTYYNLMLSAITRRSPRVGRHTGGNTDANRARQRGDPLLRSCRQSPNLDCFGMSPSPSVPAADSCNMEPGDRCMFLASSQGGRQGPCGSSIRRGLCNGRRRTGTQVPGSKQVSSWNIKGPCSASLGDGLGGSHESQGVFHPRQRCCYQPLRLSMLQTVTLETDRPRRSLSASVMSAMVTCSPALARSFQPAMKARSSSRGRIPLRRPPWGRFCGAVPAHMDRKSLL